MMDKRTKELTRLLCKWNRREMDARDLADAVWKLYRKEAMETWNEKAVRDTK